VLQEARAIKEECEAILAEALPALNAAISALDTIKKSDIQLVQVRALHDSMGHSGPCSMIAAACLRKTIADKSAAVTMIADKSARVPSSTRLTPFQAVRNRHSNTQFTS
jgi:hypothetical protein